MHFLYLDDYHLGDPLFLQRLAGLMGRAGRRGPYVLLHGSGEAAERLLEAEGLFPERVGGTPRAGSAREAALVERALRETTGRIVALLTEAGVPAVGFQGADRGLLRQEADGAVAAGKTGWLKEILGRGAVSVVSALAAVPGEAGREVPLRAAAAALGRAFATEGPTVVFFTRNDQPGVGMGGSFRERLPLAALPEEAVAEPEAVREVVRAGLGAFVSSAVGCFGGTAPRGTHILP
jgi:acetylglutamate kinase